MPAAFISHIQNYVPLDEHQQEVVHNSVKAISVKKKEQLLHEGQVCRDLYFVEKGCLRMFFVNKKGTEQITQFAIENWWLADYMSFGTRSPSQFRIQAIEPSELVALEHQAQERLLQELPQLERYFRLVQQRAYAASQLRIKYLYDYSREEGYHHFMAHYPGFAQRVPQYMLASYLGLTPEYLSEIRKRKG